MTTRQTKNQRPLTSYRGKNRLVEAAVRELDDMYRPTKRAEYQRPLTSYRGKNRLVEAAVRELDDMYGRG